MSLLTMWGYTADVNELPDLLTLDEFAEFTDDKYSKQEDRIAAEISAASAAVRNYVGWHLYPSTSCYTDMTMQDRRITRVGPDLLIQLPAKFLTAVTSVTVNGVNCAFTMETNGVLRCYDVPMAGVKRYSTVHITYMAGLPDVMMAPIKELIAHRVTHAMAVPSGITSEASGGVSVTYNASWINSAQSTTMQDANKELLAPFTLRGVF